MEKNINWLFINMKSNLYEEAMDLVYRELFKEYNYSKENILSEKENEGLHLIAISDYKVIGHARLYIENQRGQISQVVVDKEYRNLNIGSQIINRLVIKSEIMGIKFVELNSRECAIEFYEKLGFFKSGKIKKSLKTGIPLLKMKKYIK